MPDYAKIHYRPAGCTNLVWSPAIPLDDVETKRLEIINRGGVVYCITMCDKRGRC